MGGTDPRLNQALDTDHRLKCTFDAWNIEDPPANRIKPVPISVIPHMAYIADRLPATAQLLCRIANMIIIALFFLLCPGEYTNGKLDTTTFTLGDVEMFIGDRRLDLFNSSDAKLDQAR